MRDLFEVKNAKGAHPVCISDEGLRTTIGTSEGSIVLADRFFCDRLDGLEQPIIFLDAVEESKDLANLSPVIEQCRASGLNRDGHIVAAGGGVVQDIACFIASTYMRGVDWTYLPTTLLAMVDSCIGGKSSLNVGTYKNLVGTFYPPAAVVVVPEVISTLSEAHIAAGRAETAKICFARGDEAFAGYLALDGGGFRSDPTGLVELSLASKKWFIEIDEFDRAERQLLNFGHSFGHAIESCTGYTVPHGVAVGVGCLAAIAMSCRDQPALGHIDRVQRMHEQMRSILGGLGWLSPALAQIQREVFFSHWDSDKKHGSESYRPILLNETGHLYRATLARSPRTTDRIWAGFCAARSYIGED